MRTRHEPTTTRLPLVRDLFGAPERAILAALDATLQIATRSLRAEYPGLDRHGRFLPQEGWEPYVPPHVLLIERIVGAAADLHRLVVEYRAALDRALAGPALVAEHEHERRTEVPIDDDPF